VSASRDPCITVDRIVFHGSRVSLRSPGMTAVQIWSDADVDAILRTREMIDFLAAQGAEPLITSPEEFLKMLQADIVKWDKVVKSAGVTLN
jgi:tripartite-type tricarboxylate transporter receptor subunit TctC